MRYRNPLRLSLVGACALATCAFAPAAFAANGNLPGGTSISNSITAPANGASAKAPASFNVTGTASVGKAGAKADTTLIYLMDVSGSTEAPAGCGGNQNNDGINNTVMDCEIAAAKALNQKAIDTGTVDEVAVVDFSSGANVTQGLTSPSNPAVNSALGSLVPTNATNFEAAVRTACQVAAGSSNPNTTVVMLSDGFATTGDSALAEVPCTGRPNTRFETFAIGQDSDCTNVGLGNQGSLGQIAAETGGTCTKVSDVSMLPSIVPGVIESQLSKIELTVDGGAPVDVTDVTPSLPQTGPASVNYARTVSGLGVGSHELCTTAYGSDAGGNGSVKDCVTVNVTPAERAGTFSCRAQGLKALNIGLVIANDPFNPCADANPALATLNLPLLGTIRVGANVIQATTDSTPNNPKTAPVAVNDRGEADSKVTNVVLAIGLDVIRATVVSSHAEARCTAVGQAPALSGSTTITSLTRNGQNVALVNGKADINLLLGTLHINHTQKTANTVTQRAIWFESTVLGSLLDVVVAEAKAGYTGNPCT